MPSQPYTALCISHIVHDSEDKGSIKYCRNEGEFISSEFPLRSLEWYPLGCETMYVLHGTLTKGILCLVWVEHWKASKKGNGDSKNSLRAPER